MVCIPREDNAIEPWTRLQAIFSSGRHAHLLSRAHEQRHGPYGVVSWDDVERRRHLFNQKELVTVRETVPFGMSARAYYDLCSSGLSLETAGESASVKRLVTNTKKIRFGALADEFLRGGSHVLLVPGVPLDDKPGTLPDER